MKHAGRTSLSEHLSQNDANDHLAELVASLASACWLTSKALRSIALDGMTGAAETTNVQGEVQKPLDLIANDLFTRAVRRSKRVAAILSEEVADVSWIKEPEEGDFLVSFDPLDGSSNLDVGLSVGSIFSVAQVGTDGNRSILRAGNSVVCAGYAIYGPSTMLVLTLNGRVDGFTLDLDEDEYFLTHPQMTIPNSAAEFAINMSRQSHWAPPIKTYIADCVAGIDGPRRKPFNMRWTASMVAEVHRILMRGGVFLYPTDAENQPLGGKLRLMYEAIPMALIVEAAGGQATDGQSRILDIEPYDPHQRISVILGSRDEVAEVATCFAAA